MMSPLIMDHITNLVAMLTLTQGVYMQDVALPEIFYSTRRNADVDVDVGNAPAWSRLMLVGSPGAVRA